MSYHELAARALDFLSGPWPFGFLPPGRLWAISLHGNDIDRTWGNGERSLGRVGADDSTRIGPWVMMDVFNVVAVGFDGRATAE